MLKHLGHDDAGDAVLRAIETVLKDGPRTRDIGGQASTQEAGKAIAEVLADGGTRTPDLGGNAGTKDLGAAVTAAIR